MALSVQQCNMEISDVQFKEGCAIVDFKSLWGDEKVRIIFKSGNRLRVEGDAVPGGALRNLRLEFSS